MIGDGSVLVPKRASAQNDVSDAVPPVAPERVHVEIAADVDFGDEIRKGTVFRSRDFSIAEPQFWRDEGQVDPSIQVGLRGTAHGCPAEIGQPAIAKGQTTCGST